MADREQQAAAMLADHLAAAGYPRNAAAIRANQSDPLYDAIVVAMHAFAAKPNIEEAEADWVKMPRREAQALLNDLNARIDGAHLTNVPVFAGIVALHDALSTRPKTTSLAAVDDGLGNDWFGEKDRAREAWRDKFILLYQPPCGRWYVHSHKLYDTRMQAVEAINRFIHPETPTLTVSANAMVVCDGALDPRV